MVPFQKLQLRRNVSRIYVEYSVLLAEYNGVYKLMILQFEIVMIIAMTLCFKAYTKIRDTIVVIRLGVVQKSGF